MTDIVDPGTINNGDTPDWDLVQAYFDAIYTVINSPGQLTNANIDPAAAIAYSKLNLAGSIDAGDLDALPACCLAASSSLASGNITPEAWASESVDTDTMHSTSVNTSRITINTTGLYHIVTSLYIANGAGLGATDTASVTLSLAGSTIGINQDTGHTTAYAEINTILPLAATNYLETTYTQNSGSSVTATKRFSVVYLGPSS